MLGFFGIAWPDELATTYLAFHSIIWYYKIKKGVLVMEGFKVIMWILLGVAAIAGTYLYAEHLRSEGYEDRDIYLHIFHDIPLWVMKKGKASEDVYSGSPYSGHVPEYQKAEEDISDSYPSFYGANYDPNTAAWRNAPPTDHAHNQRILASGKIHRPTPLCAQRRTGAGKACRS